jgi:hypothetical protein
MSFLCRFEVEFARTNEFVLQTVWNPIGTGAKKIGKNSEQVEGWGNLLAEAK